MIFRKIGIMKKLSIITTLLLASVALLAQRPLDGTEVRIVAPFEPRISEAFKINDNPTIDDSRDERPSFTYTVAPRKLETRFQLESIRAAQVSEPALAALNHGHLRVGFGSQATPYAELFVHSNRSKTHAVGLNVRHFSSLSSISGMPFSGFSENSAHLFGTYFFGQHQLSGGLRFNHDRLHYFGFDPTQFGFAPHGQTPLPDQLLLERSDYNQNLTRFNANIGIENSENGLSSFIYGAGVDYNLFADKFEAREHAININGKIGHRLDGSVGAFENPVISIDLGAKIFGNTVNQNSLSSTIISMLPGIGYKTGNLLLFAGFDATMKIDSTKTRFGLYPNIMVEASLIGQYLNVFGRLTGSLKQQSLNELTNLNPFVDTSSELRFENTKYHISGGVKGIFSDNLAYNLSFSGARIQNHPFFVTNLDSRFQNKFLVVYDTLTRVGITGELFASFGQRAQARFGANYYHYSLKNELMPWNLPEVELSLNSKFNLSEQISITADIFGRGKTFAKDFDENNTVIGRKLHDFVVDFNLGGEYRITPTLSAFIQLQNLTGQTFQRWLNYPTRGLNVFGGIGWSF